MMAKVAGWLLVTGTICDVPTVVVGILVTGTIQKAAKKNAKAPRLCIFLFLFMFPLIKDGCEYICADKQRVSLRVETQLLLFKTHSVIHFVLADSLLPPLLVHFFQFLHIGILHR